MTLGKNLVTVLVSKVIIVQAGATQQASSAPPPLCKSDPLDVSVSLLLECDPIAVSVYHFLGCPEHHLNQATRFLQKSYAQVKKKHPWVEHIYSTIKARGINVLHESHSKFTGGI